MIFRAHDNQTRRQRLVLLFAVCACAALTLPAAASAASAQLADGLDPTSAATAGAAAPVEQVTETVTTTVPVKQAEAPVPDAETPPVETTRGTAPDSIRASATSVVDKPVAAAPRNPSISTPPAAGGRSATAVVNAVSARATSVVSAQGGPESTVVSAVKRPVAALDEGVLQKSKTTAEEIGRDLRGTVANLRQGVAEEISTLSDRLPPGIADTSLSSLLGTSGPASSGVVSPSAGPPLMGGDPSSDGPLSFLAPQQAGPFSSWSPIAAGGPAGERLTLPRLARVGKVESASHRRGAPGEVLPTATGGAGTRFDATTPEPRGPAPLDLPSPAPGSPEAIAPGSGGAPFVPFAALLALLALVAPASTRRLREAPEFRAPTPFVCALERPG